MSPGSLDHLLLLHLEGNQVDRKGKRLNVAQLDARGRWVLYKLLSDLDHQETHVGNSSSKLRGRKIFGQGVHLRAKSRILHTALTHFRAILLCCKLWFSPLWNNKAFSHLSE